MLASVLPGVRELRAPLAAGYLWLLFVWLVWGDDLPTKAEATDTAFERLDELEPVLTAVGLAVVASVGAYVLGSIVIDVQVAIGRLAFALVKLIPLLRDEFPPRGEAEQRRVAKVRLLGESEQLHAEVDRPDSEA